MRRVKPLLTNTLFHPVTAFLQVSAKILNKEGESMRTISANYRMDSP